MQTPEGRTEVFLTRGTDSCLYLFPRETWETLRRQFSGSSFGSEDERRVLRLFFASVAHELCDKQGRLTLPENLRDLVGLKSEAVFVGVQDHVELWEPARWKKYCAEGAADYESSLDRYSDRMKENGLNSGY
jgi:MraZ protein